MPLVTMVRFGQWDAIIAEYKPQERWRYMTGIWHYARGLAFAHTQKLHLADEELGMLQTIIRDPQTKQELLGLSDASTLLNIADEILAGEMAAAQKHYKAAIGHMEYAVTVEDGLLYNEPPDWYYPVRHTLGAVLLEAGEPADAEAVYRQDLKRYRENGYSLYGLWQSVKAQGRNAEAARIEERYRQAWSQADASLTSSRF